MGQRHWSGAVPTAASRSDRERLVEAEAKQPRTEASAAMATPEEAKAQPSGYRGENPSTAGSGKTEVNSNTPENRLGHLNPSAPEDTNVTPGSTAEK